VWEDDRGEYAAARGLANVLFEREHIDQAHEVLEEAIWADGKRDFEDFFCYYDKLHLYVAQGETDKIEDTLDTVTDMTETLDDRRYAAFMLAQTADELYAVNAFSLAHRFAKTARDLDDGSMMIDEQIDHLAELRELEDSLDTIMDSDRYHEIVQHMMAIYYDQATGAMSEDQAERAIENLVQGLENVMQADPDNTQIKDSLRRIRRRHPEAFELNEEFFELILDTPDADLFVDDCPLCEEPVMAEKGYSGQMYCPQCDGEVYSDGRSYSRRKDVSPSSSSVSSTQETQDESEGGIGFIIGVIVFLFFGAQMCA
jgi:tetratricopeptide (TPR) repeat protein